METYVCLLLKPDRQILTVEAFSAKSEDDARQQAAALIDTHPGAAGFELWRKGKRIGRGERGH